jgi:hypothetical protein
MSAAAADAGGSERRSGKLRELYPSFLVDDDELYRGGITWTGGLGLRLHARSC